MRRLPPSPPHWRIPHGSRRPDGPDDDESPCLVGCLCFGLLVAAAAYLLNLMRQWGWL
jgi:hypothetical protein